MATIGVPISAGGPTPSIRTVYYQAAWVPFNTVQPPTAFNYTNIGWQQQPPNAPAVAQAKPGFASVPFNTAQVSNNLVTQLSWQQQPPKAVPLAKVWPGHSSVPFNTVQPNSAFNYTNFGWYQALSIPPPIVKAQAGFASVPFDKAQLSVNFTDFSWFAPLAGAPPTAKAQVGFAYVPFDTAQLAVNFTLLDWQGQPPNAAPVAKPQAGFASVPLNTPQLSVNFTPFGWQQQPANAPAVAQAKPGFSSVPYNTAQAAPAGIAGMAWHSPLSMVPCRIAYAPQSFGFYPPRFGEIASSVRVVGRVFGRRDREYGARDPRNKYFTKKRWEELLEEVRLENETLAAPTRAKKAVLAVANAERTAAQLAQQLELEEAEQLAITLVAAERASKAIDALKQADAAMKMMAEIQARIDEDEEEVLILLLH